jgi:hypothetical protein
MTYVPPERVKELRKLDILTYFKNYRPEDLLRYDVCSYVLRCNSAIKIEKGYWSNWNKKGRLKTSALDYLIEEEHYSFINAAGHLQRLLEILPPVKATENDEHGEVFRVPWNNGDPARIRAWLCESQGLDAGLIDELIDKQLIYEEKYTHHVVFPGFNAKGEMVSAYRKSIAFDFGEPVSGSLSGYSFALKKSGADSIHLFERPLDLLKFVSGEKIRGEKDMSCLCLHMAEKEDSFFLPLLPYMKENEELKTLILHFDRDSAGIRAGEKLKKLLDEEYEVREWREEKEEC